MITQYSYGTNVCKSRKNNVIEYYKQWSAEEVRADLQPKRTQMVSIFENIGYDINIACSIRSNNAFLGKEVYVVGRRRFDSRGDVGTHHYETVYHADTIQEVVDKLRGEGYTIYAVDNLMERDPVNVWDVEFPEKSAFIFGSESDGITQEALDLADRLVYIHMDGSVRSMNVSCAASCVMFEYSRQHRCDVRDGK